ncbi:tRNA pseudouridine(55) synthase TruB [Candidatus Saccharibacteria bacterium]|nr:tRNA pseudouridine(55) synthase TruB [Candidatus Saccharibacteria bacterium]
MDEIILIDKPAGITSFGVVARVRRVLSEQLFTKTGEKRKVKVGHTGTLDPFATGLLILLTGKATKRSNEFLKMDKVYLAELHLGATSTTGDPEGEIATTALDAEPEASTEEPTHKAASEVLHSFIGQVKQIPPIYSAIKINGRRAYDLARKGEEPDMPERTVSICSIDLVEYSYPKLIIRVHCSSGTYIRTLAEDIGKQLGCGAYLTALRREKIGDYQLENAQTLKDLGITS